MKSKTKLMASTFFMLCATLAPLKAKAGSIYMAGSASSWRLENYNNSPTHPVNIWYTSSKCAQGFLHLGSATDEGTKNRLWSTILTAKVSNKDVFVFYDDQKNCEIISFGMQN